MFIKETQGNDDLILKSPKKSDVNIWSIWDTDIEVQKYMPEPMNQETSMEDELQYFEEIKNETDGIYASIFISGKDESVGLISLTEINDHHKIGELGILIGDKKFWNKGISTKSILLFLKYIKSNTDIKRIIAEVEEGNISMEKSLLKNNFKLECVCKSSRVKNGSRIDTKRFVLFI